MRVFAILMLGALVLCRYEVGPEDLQPFTKTTATKTTATSGEQEVYIQRYAGLAIDQMHKYGVPASITLAQALIESQAGSSPLVQATNNHFGIKCFLRDCAPGHCVNHTDDTHKDFFRTYKSAWASYEDHSRFVTTGRYASLTYLGNDYKKWARGLKRWGYATAPNYATVLINTIEQNHLNDYDNY